MPEKIGGLPAHPLIVHLPIVLGPVVGLLALLLLFPKWRTRLLWPTAALAVVFATSAILAAESGEQLAATLQLGEAIHEHEEAAETLRLVGFLLAIATVGVALLGSRLKGALQTGAIVVVAVLGLATIGFTVKTGHEGAKAVWEAPFDAAQEAQNSGG